MDLSLTDVQEMIRDGARRLLAKTSGSEQVRGAEATGHDPAVWQGLVDMGLPTMALGTDVGGGGASLADLGVAVEECGAAQAPAPLAEVAVTGRLLATVAPDGQWLARLTASEAIVVTALRPARDGIITLVPGAAAADAVVALDHDELVLVERGASDWRRPATLGSAAVADVDLSSGTRRVLATGTAAVAAYRRAVDEWRALTASWLVGLTDRSLDLGIVYATERRQFGVAIGSFQVLQHRLADLATGRDGVRLLARKALWALDNGEPEADAYPAMAFAAAGDIAQRTAAASLHIHGGYGFMEEYDIQLAFRRAKATRLLLGDPRHDLLVVADRSFGPPGDPLPRERSVVAGPVLVDRRDERPRLDGLEFRLPPEVDTYRAEARRWLAEHVTPEIIDRTHETGTVHDWVLHRAMARDGWISAGWPAEYGGQGRSPLEMNALTEEMYLSGAPVDGIGVANLVAHTLLIEGTEFQKDAVIPGVLAGDVMCCLGYSEPDAGSDVAACATRAVRSPSSDGGGEWVIDGQKMFTTLAHEAHFVFLLARTNTEVAKHKGLTMFVIPMDTPGISITPVHTMGGERTNITWYDAVRVGDEYRVGAVDGGWKVMMTALVFERNSAWYGEAVRLLDHAVAWAASTTDESGGSRLDDPLVRERLARAAIGNEISNLLGWRAAWMASRGALPGVEGTMAKLFTTEHYLAACDDLIDVLGAEGLRRHGEPGAAADGWIEAIYRHCQVTTIYGGTSEICRGIIAERGLGLPRSRG